MNAEKQRIAIAEACPDLFWISEVSKEVHWLYTGEVTDPLTDLNAIHEMESTLSDCVDAQCRRFIDNLESVRRKETGLGSSSFGLCHSTASQRAEAFLRTIGKWEE